MNISRLFIGTLLLIASASASAVDYTLALTVPLTEFEENVAPGSFSDNLFFTLGSPSDAGFGVGPLNFSVHGSLVRDIQSLSMSLLDSTNYVIDSGLDFTVNPLVAGTYHLQVTGLADGSLGGKYGGAISITPVPEPETWTSLLAGLAMFGFMAYRRRRMY